MDAGSFKYQPMDGQLELFTRGGWTVAWSSSSSSLSSSSELTMNVVKKKDGGGKKNPREEERWFD